jgi:hypothetical protein
VSDASTTTIWDCTVLELSEHINRFGKLAVIQPGPSLAFNIRRVYYLYGVPDGAVRAGHAHRRLHQLVVAVRGSFDVRLDDGHEQRTVELSQPSQALHLVPGIWRELWRFSRGSVCLVMASEPFDERDYLRAPADFLAFKTGTQE